MAPFPTWCAWQVENRRPLGCEPHPSLLRHVGRALSRVLRNRGEGPWLRRPDCALDHHQVLPAEHLLWSTVLEASPRAPEIIQHLSLPRIGSMLLGVKRLPGALEFQRALVPAQVAQGAVQLSTCLLPTAIFPTAWHAMSGAQPTLT